MKECDLMGVNYFTDEQVEFLRKNKYVKRVSNKRITYTLEFKELFIEEYGSKLVTQIFEDARLPKSILGKRRIDGCTSRWRKAYNERSSLGDTRKGNSGRPSTRDLATEEIIETLKQENEFLRQI